MGTEHTAITVGDYALSAGLATFAIGVSRILDQMADKVVDTALCITVLSQTQAMLDSFNADLGPGLVLRVTYPRHSTQTNLVFPHNPFTTRQRI
jgi:hypothetical protein